MPTFTHDNFQLVRVGRGAKTHIAYDVLIDGKTSGHRNTAGKCHTVCPAGSNTRGYNRKIRKLVFADIENGAITCENCRRWFEDETNRASIADPDMMPESGNGDPETIMPYMDTPDMPIPRDIEGFARLRRHPITPGTLENMTTQEITDINNRQVYFNVLAEKRVAFIKLKNNGNQVAGNLYNFVSLMTNKSILEAYVDALRNAEYDAAYRHLSGMGYKPVGAIIPDPYAGGLRDIGAVISQIQPGFNRNRLFANTAEYLQRFYESDPAAVIEFMLNGMIEK